MVIAETSASGPCTGSDVAAGELTMASGSSYSGSFPLGTVHVERHVISWWGPVNQLLHAQYLALVMPSNT